MSCCTQSINPATGRRVATAPRLARHSSVDQDVHLSTHPLGKAKSPGGSDATDTDPRPSSACARLSPAPRPLVHDSLDVACL